MSFDTLVANPGRLRILTALATETRQEFVRLRGLTRLTDGNLATHARRLAGGGLLTIDKAFRDGKPVTHFSLTPQGRTALESHARGLLNVLGMTPVAADRQIRGAEPQPVPVQGPDDEWID